MYLKNYLEVFKKHRNISKFYYTLIDRYMGEKDKVLDIGCATGSFFKIRKHKDIDYNGLDYNSGMVDHCKSNGLNVKLYDAGKDRIPFDDNCFDFIYCAHVLEHLLSNEQIHLFSEISRVLKNNGKLLLFTPTPYNRYFRDDHTHQRPSTHGSLIKLCEEFDLHPIACKYSNLHFLSQGSQRLFRTPPIRRFLREVFLIAEKKELPI